LPANTMVSSLYSEGQLKEVHYEHTVSTAPANLLADRRARFMLLCIPLK
jgi:hypothetical protein